MFKFKLSRFFPSRQYLRDQTHGDGHQYSALEHLLILQKMPFIDTALDGMVFAATFKVSGEIVIIAFEKLIM